MGSPLSLQLALIKPITPKQKLKYLEEKYKLGEITEEEYKAQRAEIINNF